MGLGEIFLILKLFIKMFIFLFLKFKLSVIDFF